MHRTRNYLPALLAVTARCGARSRRTPSARDALALLLGMAAPAVAVSSGVDRTDRLQAIRSIAAASPPRAERPAHGRRHRPRAAASGRERAPQRTFSVGTLADWVPLLVLFFVLGAALAAIGLSKIFRQR